MKNVYKKGFTLIELLVVIAIIGVLSGIVLASLNSARNKGNDAAVKANVSGVRAQAEIVYDDTGNYDAVCGNANVIAALNAASQAGAGNTTSDACFDSPTAWAASAPLRTTGQGHWCVDSTGKAATTSAAVPDTDC